MSFYLYKHMYSKNALLEKWKSLHISESLIRAFEEVPREEFILDNMKEQAYDDTALPILRGKTISQPSTVLLMTDALDVKEGMKVFEVGSGSGYQAAIISKLVGETGKVYSSEVLPELVMFAQDNLNRVGISNVEVHESDGSQGLEDFAPYDRIIITAACPMIPKLLLDQLKTNGIIVAPVGTEKEQQMKKIIKTEKGIEEISLGTFLFSPMIGKFGFEERI